VHIKGILLSVIAAFGVQQTSVEAATYIYNFGNVLRGASPRPASPPWITAQFTDVGPGQVQMTVTTSHLTRRESVGSLFLNLDPALNPSLLVFNRLNSTGSFKGPKIRAREDGFNVPDAGQFDLRFQFAGFGSSRRQFGNGDQVTYLISGIPELNASSFGFDSLTPCTGDSIAAVAQIRGIPAHRRSGWIYPADGLTPIPEPASWLLFASGLLVSGTLAARRQRRR
jgi:hypothetical protein